jgi:hypothetical protein
MLTTWPPFTTAVAVAVALVTPVMEPVGALILIVGADVYPDPPLTT